MQSSMRWLLALLLLPVGFAFGDEVAAQPHPVPLTRPEMKQAMEDMKAITPRIPLPELTAEEQALAEADPRSYGYESRVRKLYLPGSDVRGYVSFGGSRPQTQGSTSQPALVEHDPTLTLDYRFKTMLFWIASRTNNCLY